MTQFRHLKRLRQCKISVQGIARNKISIQPVFSSINSQKTCFLLQIWSNQLCWANSICSRDHFSWANWNFIQLGKNHLRGISGACEILWCWLPTSALEDSQTVTEQFGCWLFSTSLSLVLACGILRMIRSACKKKGSGSKKSKKAKWVKRSIQDLSCVMFNAVSESPE